MTDLEHRSPNERMFAEAPSMRSVSPSLRPALENSSFIFDGGPTWRAEWALDAACRGGAENHIALARRDLEQAMRPAPPQWFGKRLPILWTMFMVAREADPRALTIWMSETASLLSDLPHDIVAHAIDEAIRKSGHGFIPSVGEIRRFADPLVAERQQHIDRLAQMEAALADPVATAQRTKRRAAMQMLEEQ